MGQIISTIAFLVCFAGGAWIIVKLRYDIDLFDWVKDQVMSDLDKLKKRGDDKDGENE